MFDVLITGGAGFIGTALSKKIKNMGHNVTIIDLESKFTPVHDEYKRFSVDIRDYKNFEAVPEGEFDYIFHLAAQTSGAISQEQPELDVETNVRGTLNVCNFARSRKVKKIIFSSSVAPYGNKQGSINEKSFLEPLSNYGVSKVAGEFYIKMFKQFGVDSTIFRLFNVYGPGQDMLNLRQGMASIFMAQSILSSKIEVTGSFDRYRDFVYIDDVVDALLFGLRKECDSQIYNVGSQNSTTVRELIDLIIKVNSRPSQNFEVVNIGSHDGDQFGSVSDSSKLMSLGWSANIKLKDGLFKMYQYAKEVLT